MECPAGKNALQLLPCLYSEIVVDRRFRGRWNHDRNNTIPAVEAGSGRKVL
jgi:hypothetical protein